MIVIFKKSDIFPVEDMVDILKSLYIDHDFIFFPDKYSGRGNKIYFGIVALSTNRRFGGTHPHMRSSKRLQEDVFIGPEGRNI